MNKETELTKKDINKAAIRYMFMACNVFNYQTQQGPGVVFGLEKALKKVHQDEDDYVASLHNHYKYFNTKSVYHKLDSS